jgi:hypothetical protein
MGDANVHANVLAVRGLAPWGHALSLSPIARAIVLALSGLFAAAVAALLVLERWARSRLGALIVGASGPLAVLGAMRVFDRLPMFEDRSTWGAWVYGLLPIVAVAATIATAFLASRLLGRKRSCRV